MRPLLDINTSYHRDECLQIAYKLLYRAKRRLLPFWLDIKPINLPSIERKLTRPREDHETLELSQEAEMICV